MKLRKYHYVCMTCGKHWRFWKLTSAHKFVASRYLAKHHAVHALLKSLDKRSSRV